ncbi:hypothetical protein HYH03_012352 [Edaphochlamys debaryana]|uniref:Uncharacterized protein n=1 Tax=Edaphochlamys debaryana TaxID=47281 RepID=A0A835XVI9_9CHLO|nr:hypothetical protein HYH03_012352 [Edaphochlamys debaryana]|eukprot:KAG2489126.1 hypothetical protein HYH03_012352 [Edaphochlamys debaryana]
MLKSVSTRAAASPRATVSPVHRLSARRVVIAGTAAPVAPIATNGANGNGATAAIVPAPAAPATPAPAPPAPIPGVLPPPAAFAAVVNAGAAKAAMPGWKSFVMGIMAGCYISFGGFMAVTVATMCTGLGVGSPILTRLAMGALFPFGLLITLVCGAELYTGNTALVAAAVAEKKASVGAMLRNWACSYAGNFVGSLLMAGLVVATGLLDTSGAAKAMTVAKCSLPFGQALVRGLLCNWLVVAAVWMAAAATSLPGKMLAAYLPVMAFITLGLEHSVANMFFCSLGIAQGAPVAFTDFLTRNLLPVTLGNTLAGVLCMAAAYCLCYGTAKAQEAPKAKAA